MSAPLLLPTIALILGIVFGYIGDGLEFGVKVGFAICLIAGALVSYAILLRKSSNPILAFRLNHRHRIWIILLFVGIGVLSELAVRPPLPAQYNGIVISGRVIERTATNSGDRIILKSYPLAFPDGKNLEAQKIVVYSPPFICHIGDVIRISGSLSPISDSPDRLPTGYPERMRRQGITNRLIVKDDDNVTVIGHHDNIMTLAEEMRDRIDIAISHTGLRHETKTFLKALLIGQREEMDNDTQRSFSDAGVAHVLALSGLHVGIIVSIVLLLLRPVSFLRFKGNRSARYVVAVILVWLYAFLAGLSPTIVRAAVMVSCMAGGLMLERKRSALNSLCAAVIIIILADPMSIFDIGMQLSVACVASLILFAEVLNPVNHRSRPMLYKIAATIIATMTATFAIWPLTAWYFQRFPLLFLPVNLIVLPLLPIFIGICFLYFLLFSLGWRDSSLGLIIDKAYSLFGRLAEYAGDENTVANIGVGAETICIWIAGMIILGIGLNIAGKNKKNKRIIIFSGCWILLLGIFTSPLFLPTYEEGFIVGSSSSRISIAEYGAGEETLHNFPRGESTLISLSGQKIVIIDSPVDDLEFGPEWSNPDIMIVGNYFIGSLDDITQVLSPNTIIFHSSILTKRETAIRREFSYGIPIHSIRKDGVFRRFFHMDGNL